MSTFPDAAELLKTDIGRIEFKVALFDTQQRLLRKSRQLRIGLPHDIGMDGSVGGNEDARSMMFQLRALEKLVDFALDLKIGMVQKVEPLPVISHTIGDNNEVYLQEYPVGIEFLGSLENLYDLFYAVLEPDRVFILRHLQTETPEDNSGNPLKISAVMSALVFSKKPTEISEQQIKIRPLKPLGY